METICVRNAATNWLRTEAPLSREREGLLIDRTLLGGSDAFGDLVEPYLTLLNRYARVRLRTAAEAEDAVQQSVLLAFSHLGTFRRDASFKTWLSTIAWNQVTQVRRRRAAFTFESLGESLARRLTDPSCSPYSQAQRREDLERLRGALAALPEKYRLVIQLRDLRELSVVETAQTLSLTAGAVKTRHHRARKLLQHSLCH